jgi:hypothetical protein
MPAESFLGDEHRYGDPVGVRKRTWVKGIPFLLMPRLRPLKELRIRATRMDINFKDMSNTVSP